MQVTERRPVVDGRESGAALIAPKNVAGGVAFWGGVLLGLAFARKCGSWLQVKGGTSVAVNTLDIKRYDRVVLWVNGVDTDDGKFVATLNHLHRFLNEGTSNESPTYKVAGFHRDTCGLLDKAQSGIQLLHSRMQRCSRISKATAGELARYVDEIVEKGASVVIVAHSAGNLLAKDAYYQMKGPNRDRVGFLGLGDPHGVHPSPFHIGIMNEQDPLIKHNSRKSDQLMCPSPIGDEIDGSDHHGSRTGYLVEGTIMGDTIKRVLGDMFDILRRYPQYDPACR